MADPIKVLQRAVDRLAKAIDLSRATFDAEVENLTAVVVGLITVSENEALRELSPRIEKLYSETLVGDGQGGDRDDAVVGQLGALATLFSIAAARPGRSSVKKLLNEGLNGKLLLALKEAGAALDNQELAAKVDAAESSVARMLPKLRDAGLVSVTREWKRKLNGLTEQGEAAAAELEATSVRALAPARKSVPVKAEIAPVQTRAYDFGRSLADALKGFTAQVDVEAIARDFGATIVEAAGGRRRNVVERLAQDGAMSIKLIVGKGRSQEKRFQIASGLAELMFQVHPLMQDASHHGWKPAIMEGRQKKEVDRMATALLMPEITLVKKYCENPDISVLSHDFGVSAAKMAMRVQELNLRTLIDA